MAPHNLTFAFIGACLLWVGWFGFNAGSNLEANGLTAQAVLNTITATAAAALAWSSAKRSPVDTPACSARSRVRLPVSSRSRRPPVLPAPSARSSSARSQASICLWAVVSLKPMLKYDDSLDVFGVHGVGGIVGAIGTGDRSQRLRSAASAPAARNMRSVGQLGTQITAVVIAIVWSAVVSFVGLYIVKAIMGLRPTEAEEREGLDITSHGERAYN